jgi:hypothetical protein
MLQWHIVKKPEVSWRLQYWKRNVIYGQLLTLSLINKSHKLYLIYGYILPDRRDSLGRSRCDYWGRCTRCTRLCLNAKGPCTLLVIICNHIIGTHALEVAWKWKRYLISPSRTPYQLIGPFPLRVTMEKTRPNSVRSASVLYDWLTVSCTDPRHHAKHHHHNSVFQPGSWAWICHQFIMWVSSSVSLGVRTAEAKVSSMMHFI